MTSDSQRQTIVEAALGEVGVQKPEKYWAAVMPGALRRDFPKHWCGAFALWCWRKAGCVATWKPGSGFGLLPKDVTKTPKRGDIAYFDQPFQHYAVVTEIDGRNVRTVDGNQSGSQVLCRTRRLKDVTAFYSCNRFIPEELVDYVE
jgi:hypothetical protein